MEQDSDTILEKRKPNVNNIIAAKLKLNKKEVFQLALVYFMKYINEWGFQKTMYFQIDVTATIPIWF